MSERLDGKKQLEKMLNQPLPVSSTPRTDELAREFAGKRVSSREAGAVWNLCRDLERELNKVITSKELISMRYEKTRCDLTDMTKQRDHYKAACDQYSEDEMLCKLQEVTKQRDALAEYGNNLLDSLHSQDWQKAHAIIRSMRKALAATKGGASE